MKEVTWIEERLHVFFLIVVLVKAVNTWVLSDFGNVFYLVLQVPF